MGIELVLDRKFARSTIPQVRSPLWVRLVSFEIYCHESHAAQAREVSGMICTIETQSLFSIIIAMRGISPGDMPFST